MGWPKSRKSRDAKIKGPKVFIVSRGANFSQNIDKIQNTGRGRIGTLCNLQSRFSVERLRKVSRIPAIRRHHCVKSVQMRSFLWSLFSHIRTEFSPYSVQMPENMYQKNSNSACFSDYYMLKKLPRSLPQKRCSDNISLYV